MDIHAPVRLVGIDGEEVNSVDDFELEFWLEVTDGLDNATVHKWLYCRQHNYLPSGAAATGNTGRDPSYHSYEGGTSVSNTSIVAVFEEGLSLVSTYGGSILDSTRGMIYPNPHGRLRGRIAL